MKLVNIRSYWNRVDPLSNMISDLINKEIWTQAERTPCEDEGKDQDDASTRQGKPNIASRPQEPSGGAWEKFSLTAQKEQILLTPSFQSSGLQNCEPINFYHLSHLVTEALANQCKIISEF